MISMESSETITIVIPMAGLGSRFSEAGYKDPKPFIPVNGRPMIHRVMENLWVDGAKFILVCLRHHVDQYHLVFNELQSSFDVEVVSIESPTEGTAITVLAAHRKLNDAENLIIANSDQIISGGISEFVHNAIGRQVSGSILCFKDQDRNPKWSFARVDDSGAVVEVREKEPISDLATVGVYYFRTGREYIQATNDMIVKNERVNGEFYTCPVYNHLIAAGGKAVTYIIPESSMWGIGTPEDLNRYLDNNVG